MSAGALGTASSVGADFSNVISDIESRCMGHMTTRLPNFVKQIASLMVSLNQNVVNTEAAKALAPDERQSLASMSMALA